MHTAPPPPPLPQVAVTSFFRNSSQFSYAALVAGFTAVVIFTGSNTVLGADGEAVSLARIINTVVGSVIYLFVDLLLGADRVGVGVALFKGFVIYIHAVMSGVW